MEMRKNYYKDLVTYKGNVKTWKQVQENPKNPNLPERDQVSVEFFNVLEGVDQEITDIINQRIAEIKESCEKRLFDHIKYQQELLWPCINYVECFILKRIHCMNKLSPNAYSMVNLTLTDIVSSLALVHSQTQVIWDEIHKHYGQDCFLTIIEKEYGGRFAKDYTFLNQEIDKVKEEAQYQIKEVLKQSQNEIQFLRRNLDNKNQEIVHLKENQMQIVQKAQKEAYFHLEVQFKTKEAKLFQKNDQEKAELYTKIKELETVNTNFDQILTKQSMKFCLMKLSLLGTFNKFLREIKDSQQPEEGLPPQQLHPKLVESAINRIFDIILGRTTQEIQTLKQEYEGDIKLLMDENNSMSVELAEKKLIEQQLGEKVAFLEQCLSDSQQEAQMYKNQVESMKEENRKLEGEHGTLTRALENSQKFCEGLEREKKRIEFELQRIAGNNINKYQSAFAEADLHRKKALNSISNTGAATLNTIFGQNQKTKGTMTNIKDVNLEVVAMKKDQGSGTSIDRSRYLPAFTQTDTDVVVLTEQEYKKLLDRQGSQSPQARKLSRNQTPKSHHSYLVSIKKTQESVSEGNSPRSASSHGQWKQKGGSMDMEIQCELLVGDATGAVLNNSPKAGEVDLGVSLGDWKNRYVSGRDKISLIKDSHVKLELKKLKGDKKQDLYRNLLKIEKYVHCHNSYRELPPVYRRLWLNVFEKAGKYQKIKQEFERVRKEQWSKVCALNTNPRNKAFQKDPITGKVFINLVELYRDAKIKQIFTQKNMMIARRRVHDQDISVELQSTRSPERKDDLNEAIEGYSQASPIRAEEKQLVSQGMQTEPYGKVAHFDMSRNNSAFLQKRHTMNHPQTEPKQLKKSLKRGTYYEANSFERSKNSFIKHQRSRQHQLTNFSSMAQSVTREKESPFSNSYVRKHSKKEDPANTTQSIFEMPSMLQNSYIKDDDYSMPVNRSTVHKDQSFPSFTIYLNQPRVKISKVQQ